MSAGVTLPRGLAHPEAFHGRGRRAPFFEAWYVKLVDASGDRSLALIPGLFRGLGADSAHALLQVVDASAPWTHYHRGPCERFEAAEDRFSVSLQAAGRDHHFDEQGLEVDLPELEGRVEFGPLDPWPVLPRSPGAMGPFAFAPGLECRHGICSFGHGLKGELRVGSERWNLDGGRGYIEKDWGSTFPRSWAWVQCEHFEAHPAACLAFSSASVPWLGLRFPGLLCGMKVGDELYRFATYTGARVQSLERAGNRLQIEVVDRHHRLSIHTVGGRPTPIHIPSQLDMRGMVTEHIGAEVNVRLERGKTLLFESMGRQGAWELHGAHRLRNGKNKIA